MNVENMRNIAMRNEYDFSNSIPNPYVNKVKKQITIRLDDDVIEYFKALSEKNDIPYQSLINLYLKDCITNKKELVINWKGTDSSSS